MVQTDKRDSVKVWAVHPNRRDVINLAPVKQQECPGLSKTNSSLSLTVTGQRNHHIWLNRACALSGNSVWTNRAGLHTAPTGL